MVQRGACGRPSSSEALKKVALTPGQLTFVTRGIQLSAPTSRSSTVSPVSPVTLGVAESPAASKLSGRRFTQNFITPNKTSSTKLYRYFMTVKKMINLVENPLILVPYGINQGLSLNIDVFKRSDCPKRLFAKSFSIFSRQKRSFDVLLTSD